MFATLPQVSARFLNSRRGTSLAVLFLYFLLLLWRGWSGLNQIPTDPNYDFFQREGVFTFISLSPSLNIDNPLIAQIATYFPIDHHARVANIISHWIWACCALGIFITIRHRTDRFLLAVITGLSIVLSPWAAQSMLGSYGNVRWPILVAILTVCSRQLLSPDPNHRVLWMASIAAALTNPLAGLLAIPLFVAWMRRTPFFIHTSIAVLSMPLLIFLINVYLTGGSGHSAKVTQLWSGAGLFWTAGQLLPSAIACTGLLFFGVFRKHLRDNSVLGATLLVCSVTLTLLCYLLGGIADRYFLGPAALSGIGILLLLDSLHLKARVRRSLLAVVLSISLIPAVKWFSVFPWLNSSIPWSEQVQLARRDCQESGRVSVELLTSDGMTLTNPIPCLILAVNE